MIRPDIDAGEIQALVHTGFGSLKEASYLLLRVTDPSAARAWLGRLRPAVLADLPMAGGSGALQKAVQVAMTAAGLRALGVDGAIVARFAPEFVGGLTGSTNRSRRLGDTGLNAPENWQWGWGDREPHVLLMLFATGPTHEAQVAQARTEAEASGFKVFAVLPTNDMGAVEPFGFADGVSQPVFDWHAERIPGTAADRRYTNLLTLGEILLGYPNEYGTASASPMVAPGEDRSSGLRVQPSGDHDLGRNGSYLVHRQLAQDVRGFWRWAKEEAARSGITAVAMAEAAVGRRLGGAPMDDLVRGREIPGVAADDDVNGFLFDSDPEGLSCPIGAHVRRANPRSGDLPDGVETPLDRLLTALGLTARRPGKAISTTQPWPANTSVLPQLAPNADAIASARFHRILRRGREYGTRLDPAAAMDPTAPDSQAGLHFLCLNANLARQFEFVQGAWIASANFAGLNGEQDPLLGNREPLPTALTGDLRPTDGFTRPAAAPNCRHASGVPLFVTVLGGAYFFLPGLAALRWIAAG